MVERIEDGYVFGFDEEATIAEFEELTRDAGRVQRDTLRKILEANGRTEYLQQKCGLKGRTDPENFKACVPLVTYDDMEPYIRRIVDGEKSPILTGNPINKITLSSGTSQGKQKYVPFNDETVANYMQIRKTSFAFRNREYPIGNGKALQFIYSSKQFITKGGLHAGTFSTHVFRHGTYKKLMQAMKTPYCSPDEVIFGDGFHQSLYCHWLCGLLFRDEIQGIYSTFAHSILQALRSFENIWEELVNGIREGSLSSQITSKSIQSAMAKLLKPDPVLAKTIQDKCLGLHNWYGLIPEMFPNVKYVYGVMTGSMEPYVEKLRHYAGGLPLLSMDYGSSEGWIGANVNPKLPPEMVTFAVLPNTGYFEFIPLGEGMDSSGKWGEPQPVGLTEVEAGKEYEIVITNFAGLYRYKLGDVVKVQGFHNSTPELQFICRSNVLLNINIDKTTERDLKLAVESSAKLLAGEKLQVIDYSSFVDVSKEPGHYVIYWEINGKASNEILEECCNCLDKSFVDAGYMSSRKVNGISPLELCILKRGTFQKIMDHCMELGAAASQYKTPRCIGHHNSKVVQILASNVTKNYFSTAYEKVIGASGV